MFQFWWLALKCGIQFCNARPDILGQHVQGGRNNAAENLEAMVGVDLLGVRVGGVDDQCLDSNMSGNLCGNAQGVHEQAATAATPFKPYVFRRLSSPVTRR